MAPTSPLYRVPLTLTPQPEGGFTVTSDALPELITEGNTIQEVMQNVQDALAATIELYADLNKPLPLHVAEPTPKQAISFEYLIPGV